MASSSNWRGYVWKVYFEVEALRERGCCNCGSLSNVEFAHIKPTEVNGRGRGAHRRRLDILRHKDCYAPLCRRCHRVFDYGPQTKREAIRIVPLSEPVQGELAA